MGLALLWSLVAIALLLSYHLRAPLGTTSITTNGHTYIGNPPALTLFERDPVSFSIVAAVLGIGLLIGSVDLLVRFRQHSFRRGIAAIVAGAVVLLVSSFGLIIGVAGIGVVGALLIASGIAQTRGEN